MTATAEIAPAAHRGSHGHGDQFSRELGAWLRLHRETRRLSLTDVERLSGGRFKARTLQSYETGNRTVPAEMLAGLAGFYDVEPADLLPECAPGPRAGRRLTPNQAAVLTVLGSDPLTDAELAAALPSRSLQRIRRAARSLEILGLAAGTGVNAAAITDAGREILAANGAPR